ncbi:MAG TPA: hypothetical protein VF129_14300 [Actinomycetota bacterium]
MNHHTTDEHARSNESDEDRLQFLATNQVASGPTDEEAAEWERHVAQRGGPFASAVSVDQGHPGEPSGVSPASGGRPAGGRAVHALVFVVALAAWVVIAVGLPILIEGVLTKDVYFSEQARDAAVLRATILAVGAYVLYVVGTMALIATRVGYRLRDGLLVFVPIYGFFFVLKMLWRWTGLPDPAWDPRDPSKERAEALPSARDRRRQLVIAVLSLVVVVGAVGYGVSQSADGGSGSDGWRTTHVGGMSISLSRSFEVITDAGDYAQAAAEVGEPATDDLAELIRQFPDFFVLFAIEPLPNRMDTGTSLVVMRFPSGGSFDEFTEEFATEMEKGGFVETTAEDEITVGAGRYSAVRFENKGHLPGLPLSQSAIYLIDGGSQVWMVEFTTPPEEFERLSPTFERSIASFTVS